MRYQKLCGGLGDADRFECYFEGVVVRANRRGLSEEQYSDMLEMLHGLSVAERNMLADPDFITEDEADLIWSDRAMKESGRSYSLDEVLRENGIPRRQRRA